LHRVNYPVSIDNGSFDIKSKKGDNMNKEKLSEIIETLKASLPIETVMEDFGVKLYRCGKNYNAFSPFRTGNRSRTSFTISPKLNIFKDWVTGQAGDSIKFVSLLENVSYPEAALILARKYGYITEEEFQGRKKFTKKFSEALERKHNKIEKEEHKIAKPEVLDKVFRLFLSHTKLSDEHKKHLLEERKLSEEDIKKHMFFSFPSRAIMRKLLKDIENETFEGYDNPLDVLKDVPGFFKRKEDSNFTFMKYKGIGIPIKNAFDQIIGIQIRSDEVKEGYSRYLWFSSSFAIDDPDGKVEFGTSSGSPIDVVIPDNIKYSVLFITEGKFKSVKIANTYNCIAISVQGIGTWRNILDSIKEIECSEKIKEKYGKDFLVKNVFMAFDSDICHNVAVFNQLKKLTDTLLEEKPRLNIYYTYWDINYGKGIDDLINNGHKDKIKKYEKSVWDSRYEKVIEKAKEDENIDEIWKIPKEKFAEYFEKYMV